MKIFHFFQMLVSFNMSSYVCFPLMFVAQDTRPDVTSKVARQIRHINNRIFFAPSLVKGCLVSGSPRNTSLAFFRRCTHVFSFQEMTRAAQKIQNCVSYVLVNITEADSQANFTKTGNQGLNRGKVLLLIVLFLSV